jgi:hypothetical protein
MTARTCFYLGLGLLAASLSIHAAEAPAVTAREVSLTVRADQSQREVPRHFLGISIEKEQLNSGELARGNSAMTHLLENLGEGTLRIGGNGADYTAFAPAQSQLPSACRIQETVTPAVIEETFRFLQQVKWQVIYDLNLGCFAPDSAAMEAKYVNSVSGGSLLAFEIGNEPDMFHLQGYREASYDTASFLEQYHAYRTALQKAVPDIRLSGPGVGLFLNGVNWLPKFLTAEPQGLVFASVHFYPMVRPDRVPKGIPAILESSPAYPTIAHMLNPRTPAYITDYIFAPQVHAAEAQKLPFRITEMNSAAGGGQPGVSDVFASALWVLDYSFRFLSLGADGIDITTDLPHGGVYSAIRVEKGVHTARPIYYGMLFFHQAAQGRLTQSELGDEASELNFSAYSTVGPDHVVRVTLINKDPAITVRTRIQVTGGSYGPARVMRLSAPSLDSATGVELGGAAVRPDGSWQPKTWETIRDEAGILSVSVPPGSAALVIMEPRSQAGH